jgi:uncharacterized protein (DUF1501 family)
MLMLSRRAFLTKSSLIALAPTVPGFLARTARAAEARREARLLVVVQLDGGNDGINTVVPFKDEGYEKVRQTLRLPTERLVKVNGDLGLHFAMTEMGKLYEKGRLTIVQGVGYPNPSRSHFESMAVWLSARRETKEHNQFGWLGRAFDEPGHVPAGTPAALYVGAGELPVALRGRRMIASAMTRPEDFALDPLVADRALVEASPTGDDLLAYVRRQSLDAYMTADRMGKVLQGSSDGASYPPTALAGQLQTIARLIKADSGARIYYARQPGYDTHASQYGPHQQLLGELSGGIGAFMADLESAKLAERVCVLIFSEFGRTVKENGSAGTDHGTSAPVFVSGGAVKGGLVGKTPKLLDLDPKHGDLKVNLDFRQVYATLLEDWLNVKSAAALSGTFEKVAIVKG